MIPIDLESRVERLLKKIRADEFKDLWMRYSFRPIRPDELNTTFTVTNRNYATTVAAAYVAAAYQRILGSTSDIRVPTDAVYVFYGWWVVDNENEPIDHASMLRISVENVLKQECCPIVVSQSLNNMIILWDQVVIATSGQIVDIRFDRGSNGDGINDRKYNIYPLGYNIGKIDKLKQN